MNAKHIDSPDGPPKHPSVLEVRTEFFAKQGLAADGGYNARWVHVKIGRLPLVIPNTKSRIRAVRYHDLHHALAGFGVTMAEETRISAWEIAAGGCRDFGAAWGLNLTGLPLGWFYSPRKLARAYAWGRRCQNLYVYDFPKLLEMPAATLRQKMGVDKPMPEPTFYDYAVCFGWTILGLIVGLAPLALIVAVVVFFARMWS